MIAVATWLPPPPLLLPPSSIHSSPPHPTLSRLPPCAGPMPDAGAAGRDLPRLPGLPGPGHVPRPRGEGNCIILMEQACKRGFLVASRMAARCSGHLTSQPVLCFLYLHVSSTLQARHCQHSPANRAVLLTPAADPAARLALQRVRHRARRGGGGGAAVRPAAAGAAVALTACSVLQ